MLRILVGLLVAGSGCFFFGPRAGAQASSSTAKTVSVANATTTPIVTSTVRVNLLRNPLSRIRRVTSSEASDFIVTKDDISRAGFTDPAKISPTGTRFQEPVRYFRVGERIPADKARWDCDDCGQLLAVYVSRVFPTSTPAWVAHANPMVTSTGGRMRLEWFVASRIISITAPGEESKVRSLAGWLRERAILGKIN